MLKCRKVLVIISSLARLCSHHHLLPSTSSTFPYFVSWCVDLSLHLCSKVQEFCSFYTKLSGNPNPMLPGENPNHWARGWCHDPGPCVVQHHPSRDTKGSELSGETACTLNPLQMITKDFSWIIKIPVLFFQEGQTVTILLHPPPTPTPVALPVSACCSAGSLDIKQDCRAMPV